MKQIWPAVLLAWIAGFVDSLGYLALTKVFTAHMSGDAAAVGAELGSGNWHEAVVRGLVIPGFILGIAIGTLIEGWARRRCARAKLVPALVLEMGLLLSFLIVERTSPGASPAAGTLQYFFRVWLLASAMGIQSATLRHAGGARVRTTYISGMLTNMTENAVLRFFQMLIRQPNPQSVEQPSSHKPSARRAAIFGLIFFSFLLGGVCGGFGQTRWGSIALLAPMGGLLFLILEDWIRPIRR